MNTNLNVNTIAVVGSQWGDEGKGKIIDYLANRAYMVVRAQGGNNAGHTVVIEGKEYALHLVPSGVLQPECINIIGNGVVLDIEGFFEEIDCLNKDGVNTDHIYISDRAHIVFSYHKKLDSLYEKARGDKDIGTTLKGIGPAYMDKVERTGVRTCDLQDPKAFEVLLRGQLDKKDEFIQKLFGEAAQSKESKEGEVEKYLAYAKRLAPYIRDTGLMVYEAVSSGKKVLFEGAQAAMLDLDLGTYPYVTSSHPTTGGFLIGSGVGPRSINEVIGVVKAYTTRVGKGPFVTELTDQVGDHIREKGHEYGTTTGRPRRCGWFDSVVVKYSARINGATALSLMLVDVLDELDEIKLCYSYEIDGKKIGDFPARLDKIDSARPVYKTLAGWKQDISQCKSYEDLPAACKSYIQTIEDLVGVPIRIISVGPKRSQTIIRGELW